jgi:hypothetical protein
MARTGTVNQSPATGAVAIYTVISQLVSSGWAKISDSDGTTYSSGGTQVTSGAAGAGGLGNSLAWFVLRDPGSRRQFCFQKSSANNTQWRIKFSESAGFSGGSPGATRVPSATDEQVILGSGTDASPTMATLLNTDGGYRFHVISESAVVTGSNVYMFWFGTSRSTTGECDALFMCEGLRAGSYDASSTPDTSPCVVWCSYNATLGIDYLWFGSAAPVTAHNCKAWFKHGLSGSAWQAVNCNGFGTANVGYPVYSGTTNQVGQWAADSYEGGIEMLFVRCNNNSAPNGPKGAAAHMKHCFYARDYPNTFGFNTADPYVYWGKQNAGGGCVILLPWITGTAPSL